MTPIAGYTNTITENEDAQNTEDSMLLAQSVSIKPAKKKTCNNCHGENKIRANKQKKSENGRKNYNEEQQANSIAGEMLDDSKNVSSCEEEALGILDTNNRGNVFTLAAATKGITKTKQRRREIYQERGAAEETKIYDLI